MATATSTTAETLPPLTFEPRFVEKIWGGRRLETVLKKKLPEAVNVGEAWEIFDFPPGVVEGNKEWLSAGVATGELKGKTLHELMTSHRAALLGDHKPLDLGYGEQFPLLVKYLDAREDLSLQVHPPAAYAEKHKEAHLKTECWIVLDHTPGAFLYKGLKPGISREKLEASLKAGGRQVLETFAHAPARRGDCHFLPSGTVHALGAGMLVAEVQTPSDTTFRVYDFDRVEAATGKPRKLHVAEAMECIDFDREDNEHAPVVTSTRNAGLPLVDCAFFKTVTQKVPAHAVLPLRRGEMKIWMVLDGSVKLRWGTQQLNVRTGQTVLLPSGLVGGVMANFGATTTYLETTLPAGK